MFKTVIVLEIVILESSLSNDSSNITLLFLLLPVGSRKGTLHPPGYKEDNLYSSIVCFGDNAISHEIVTEFNFKERHLFHCATVTRSRQIKSRRVLLLRLITLEYFSQSKMRSSDHIVDRWRWDATSQIELRDAV